MTRSTRSLLVRAGVAAAVVASGTSIAVAAPSGGDAVVASARTEAAPARPAFDPAADPETTLSTLAGVAQRRRDEAAAAAAQAAAEAQAAADAAAVAAAQAEAERAAAAAEAARTMVREAQTPEGAKAAARALMADYGWSDGQFDCLESLWQRESNWRYNARNPSSGAYGIPQSLPGSKMASVADDWRENPITQITWGLGYIEGRYGTPCSAWSHSQSVGWY